MVLPGCRQPHEAGLTMAVGPACCPRGGVGQVLHCFSLRRVPAAACPGRIRTCADGFGEATVNRRPCCHGWLLSWNWCLAPGWRSTVSPQTQTAMGPSAPWRELISMWSPVRLTSMR